MTKQMRNGMAIAGVVIGGMLIYSVVQTKSQQSATQQQLEELKRQMAAATMPAAAANRGTVAVLKETPAADGAALAKEKATQDYLKEGFRLLNTRDPKNAEQAAAIFREAIEKVDAKNVHFHHGLGRALMVAGKYEEAIDAFEAGRKIDDKRPELVSGEGWAYWNLKKYAEAKHAWEEALKLDPTSEDALMVLSWVYLAMGDDDKSRQAFVTLLKIDADRMEWKNGLTMARAGNHNIDQIRTQFKGMPDPQAFKTAASQGSGI